jgi:hypothetical protein
MICTLHCHYNDNTNYWKKKSLCYLSRPTQSTYRYKCHKLTDYNRQDWTTNKNTLHHSSIENFFTW